MIRSRVRALTSAVSIDDVPLLILCESSGLVVEFAIVLVARSHMCPQREDLHPTDVTRVIMWTVVGNAFIYSFE